MTVNLHETTNKTGISLKSVQKMTSLFNITVVNISRCTQKTDLKNDRIKAALKTDLVDKYSNLFNKIYVLI